MERPLYFDDMNLKEFDAEIISVKDGKYIVLDNTAFYPQSGGQPWDEGVMIRNGEEFKVKFAGKFEGKISHEIDREGLKEGDKVHCKIDWERRYKLMRSHTSAHIVSGVFSKEGGLLITGNQLAVDKVRIDFNMENFDREKMEEYIKKANEIMEKDLPIKVSYLTREEALKEGENSDLFKLAKGFSSEIKEIRIISIGEWDRQADGGTHVRSTKEVGKIKLLKFENKGASNRRIYYELE